MKWIHNGLYLADLMVRMAHHSTAIEGNTLTLGDTRSILINGIVPKTSRLREVFEVANYKNFIPYLTEHFEEPISLSTIQDVNEILLRNIDRRGGQFKRSENMIVGAGFLPVHPSMVRPALMQWCDNLTYRMEHAESLSDKLEIVMDFHIQFEKIHPFSDGNGRTGRALIILSCAQQNLIPVVIEKEQRDEYISLLNNEDVKGLTALAGMIQEKERIRLELAEQCLKNNNK